MADSSSSVPLTPLEEAQQLDHQALHLYVQRKYDEAIPLVERVLAIREEALGREHPDVAEALCVLAGLYEAKSDYSRAELLYARALAIQEKALGPEHLDFAASLNALAGLYTTKGDYSRAESLSTRALAIQEKALGPSHAQIALSLRILAALYEDMGDTARAESLYTRALAIGEKALGPDHKDIASSLRNLATLYSNMGNYARAESLYTRALAIMEKALGPEHPGVARSLGDLAWLCHAKGDYVRAEPLYTRALAIMEKAFGPEDPDVAIALDDLAGLYRDMGDYARAEPLYIRALAIQEKVLGPEQPGVVHPLDGLAGLYLWMGHFARAESLYVRALAIQEKALGPEHPRIANALASLAGLYFNEGEYARAESLETRSLAIMEKTAGPEHPRIAADLHNMALLHLATGNYARAESLLMRSLAIAEKVWGPEHPDVATTFDHLAMLNDARSATREALSCQTRAAEIRERNLEAILNTGSQDQKRAYLATLREQTDYIVSRDLASVPADPSATRLALTTILRRKGRALKAMVDVLGAVRGHLKEEDRVLLDRLRSVQTRLSSLYWRGSGDLDPAVYRAQIDELGDQMRALEKEICARSAEYRAATEPTTMEQVQLKIPQAAALVEFVVYNAYEIKAHRWGPPRYAAYVLRLAGDPQRVDLGEVGAIDASVAALRQALGNPYSRQTQSTARDLDAQVLAPLRDLLADVSMVLVSPDGALNLVPFGALVDDSGRFRIEQQTFVTLTSGRDLLRLVSGGPNEPPLVLADPDFDHLETTATGTGGPEAVLVPQRSAARRRVPFAPLPGTRGEAKALRTLLAGARVLVGREATESALKMAHAPEILHLATHGFFLKDQIQAPPSTPGKMLLVETAEPPFGSRNEDPLLRSGLALAGANLLVQQGEDGILTALETSGLDLWGTKLVVLSACETGVGQINVGEGVYGLRRALVLAGARSLVMSLWKVDTDATGDLMVAYYTRLIQGDDCAQALRQVQLEMLHSTNRSHPYYWASFIQSGDWACLRGDAAGAER